MDELNTSGKMPRQIRKWVCHKMECFSDFIEAYARTLRNAGYCYIGLFSGSGSYSCEGTDCNMDDAELRALRADFTRYIFVVKNKPDAESLKRLTEPHQTGNIEIITGNCIREDVIHRVFDMVPRSAASFAFIDPPGYRRLRWATIKKIIAHGSDWKGHRIDLLIIFPLEMALLRNLARPECEASITRLYGNRKWLDIKQARLDGKIELSEVRHRLVELFKVGLRSQGYKYVESIEPTHFANPPFYHPILASDSAAGIKILKNAWSKPRYLPCELLYEKGNP
jgi:three-Cys-motif partner protein